jgi:dTDP-4-dehydrorhamnose reductase
MSVLIFGSNGMLGKYVSSYFSKIYNVINISRKDFDIYEEFNKNQLCESIKKLLLSLKPSFAINCAGIINKRPDISIDEMFVVNAHFPNILGKICEELDIVLIHPTTDCVYSGKKGNYTEDDILDCKDMYGLSKSLGEKTYKNTIILRVSIIGIDKDKKGLLSWAIDNKGKTISGYTKHFWNGITCLEYAKLMNEIIHSKEYTKFLNKITHISCKDVVSKYELLKIISNIYDLNLNVIATDTEKNDRSLVSNIVRKTIDEQIKEMKEFDNNIYILPMDFKIYEKNIMIITSAINSTSIFSPFERYKQTLESIQSVRKYLPDTTIVLIEVTKIENEWLNNLSQKCDYVIYCIEDEKIQRINNHWNIGFGEYVLIKKVLSHLDKPDKIYKLSGRYTLNENLTFNYYYDKYNFLYRESSYQTTFYVMPNDIESCINILDKCYELMINNNNISIEEALLKNINPEKVHLLSKLGCSGYISGRHTINSKPIFYSF